MHLEKCDSDTSVISYHSATESISDTVELFGNSDEVIHEIDDSGPGSKNNEKRAGIKKQDLAFSSSEYGL